MKQVDAVYAAVVSVTGFKGEGKCELSSEQKKLVSLALVEGFMSGKIEYSGELSEEKIVKYVPGLINNHLRKDKRLNGGVKYEAKNPGSRSGQGDEQLTAMRNLLKLPNLSDEQRAEIESEIANRLAEIKAVKAPEVNWDALPEHIRLKFAK